MASLQHAFGRNFSFLASLFGSTSLLMTFGTTQPTQAQSARAVQQPRQRALGQAPGLESFAVQPKTPDELIKAIDYLVRVGLENQAVPLASKLAAIEADDETLDTLRQSYGSAKLLALSSTNDANLNDAMGRFVDKLNVASSRLAHDPDRIRRLIDQLSATAEEREIAVERLARLGPASIDSFVKELSAPELDARKRSQLQFALDHLESSAVPALVGALRHPDATVRTAILQALANIGDARALPWAVFESARPEGAKSAAAEAVATLNGGQYVDDPVRFLISESARYLDRDVYFGDPSVETWFWDDRDKSLKAISMPAESARGAIGYRLARMALELEPTSEAAHTLIVSLLIDEESRRIGAAFPDEKDPLGAWPMILASGPRTLNYVLKRALITGRHENIAILAARALGEVTRQSDISSASGRPNVLIEAIDSPDRRVQFEAAKAIAKLDPRAPFPGSSRVVPSLARFLRSNPVAPRAVVINDNVGKGSEWVSDLRSMGYDAVLETSSSLAFEEIASRGDVELILVSTFLDPAGWALHETVANFSADSRTAGIPLIVVGRLDARSRLSTLLGGNPKVGFMVDPANESWAKRQIESQLARMSRTELTADERKAFSAEAAQILGEISKPESGSIFAAAVKSLEPLLKSRITAAAVSRTPEADIDPNSWVETILGETSSKEDRIRAGEALAESMRQSRFDLDASQRDKILELFLKKENGKELDLESVIGRLAGLCDPSPQDVGRFFSKYAPAVNFYETLRDSADSKAP
ncbi:hypothetical protein GC170_03340 [bacterium]|nr:hypothetical protein [bacterium]